MKILQVVHSFPPQSFAGTEVYAYNLSCALTERHEVFIFYRINDLKQSEYSIWDSNLGSLELFGINNNFKLYESFENTYKNKPIAEKFALILEQIKPDVVHIQSLLYLGAGIIEEIKKRNIPVFFTLHDYWLICPQGQLFKKNNVVCNGNISISCLDCLRHQLSINKSTFSNYYWLKKCLPESLSLFLTDIYLSFYKLFCLKSKKAIKLLQERMDYMKYICNFVDRFICPSRFLRDRFSEFGISKEKLIFLPYGFNLSRFEDLQKASSNKIRFGFIGNILPAKGLHVLVKAFNKIHNDNAELKIYGKAASYKSILSGYLNQVKKLVKNKNIKFMGGFDNRDIAKIFQEIDILVVPSLWYENSPLVIQEAFAAKTLVIASRIGGIPELIQNGGNGFLFEAGNEAKLYRIMSTVIQAPGLIKGMKSNLKPPKIIEENAKEIEGLYEIFFACAKIL